MTSTPITVPVPKNIYATQRVLLIYVQWIDHRNESVPRRLTDELSERPCVEERESGRWKRKEGVRKKEGEGGRRREKGRRGKQKGQVMVQRETEFVCER